MRTAYSLKLRPINTASEALFIYLLVMLRIKLKPRASCMEEKASITELHPLKSYSK
jgi:hypothetical protein